jgi:hypothetical protein
VYRIGASTFFEGSIPAQATSQKVILALWTSVRE